MPARSNALRLACLAMVSLTPSAGAFASMIELWSLRESHAAHATEATEAALAAAGVDAIWIDAPIANENRKLHALRTGMVDIDIVPATAERLALEANGDIASVPFPLDRGLLGWRIAFVPTDARDRLSAVHSLADLRKFVVAQGRGWRDIALYEDAGLTVYEVSRWRGAQFARELHAGLADLFPLGVDEANSHFLPRVEAAGADLVIEPHIAIRYPWFRFVWVSKKSEHFALLMDALPRGFDRLVAEGDFDEIHRRHHHDEAVKTLIGRQVIEIDNPFYDYGLVPPRYQHLLFEAIR